MTPASVQPAAIVLAGGASSRFGADKLAADMGGLPVLARAVAAVRAVASPVVLVLAPDAPVPAWADAGQGGLLVARDPELFGGPLVGLGAGLRMLAAQPSPASIALVVAGDMPTLAPEVLELLAAALASDPLAGAATLEADPRSVFPLALLAGPATAAVDAILAAGGRRSMRALLDSLPNAIVPASTWRAVDPAAASLRDVDTPADLG